MWGVDLTDKKILVTGGAGFIGSNLVEYLLNNGVKEIRVLDNLATGKKENIEEFINQPNFTFIEGDIRNLKDCKKACSGIDYVSHQAALGSVPRSLKDPITSNEVNINGFLNMLVAAKEANIKSFVYAASSSTYGDSKTLPKVEQNIGMPLSPYAVTKYANELYAHVFALNYGMSIIGLRYFNVFGPKQDPNGAYAAVIPLFMKAILQNEPPTLNGTGEQSRDFTYVENAVQANIRTLFTKSSEGHEVVNVACGEETSLKELWTSIQQVAQVELKEIYGPERAGDVKHSLADLSKISEKFGYQPEVKINQGLEKTYDFFKNQFLNKTT